MDNKLTISLIWIVDIVLLVITFRHIEFRYREYLRNNWFWPNLFLLKFLDEFCCRSLLIPVVIENCRPILRPSTLAQCRKSHAVLLGAVGGPKWDNPGAKIRPEDALLAVRKELDLFANIRPIRVYSSLKASSVIKPKVLKGVDMVVIRELTGGLYYGKPKKRWQTRTGWKGVDTMLYTEKEIDRVLDVGFELANMRRKHLTVVDKANILESSRLWRQLAIAKAANHPNIHVDYLLVDACAMVLMQRPSQFDVIVTENTFGDILTDEASVLTASMGMLPSASLAQVPSRGKQAFGLYEPIHGTAPDIEGKGIANPLATILSTALMLRYSLGLPKEALRVENSVDRVLAAGYRTPDIATKNSLVIGTTGMGERVRAELYKR